MDVPRHAAHTEGMTTTSTKSNRRGGPALPGKVAALTPTTAPKGQTHEISRMGGYGGRHSLGRRSHSRIHDSGYRRQWRHVHHAHCAASRIGKRSHPHGHTRRLPRYASARRQHAKGTSATRAADARAPVEGGSRHRRTHVGASGPNWRSGNSITPPCQRRISPLGPSSCRPSYHTTSPSTYGPRPGISAMRHLFRGTAARCDASLLHRRTTQNSPIHIRAKLFTAHSRHALNAWAMLCRHPVDPPLLHNRVRT